MVSTRVTSSYAGELCAEVCLSGDCQGADIPEPNFGSAPQPRVGGKYIGATTPLTVPDIAPFRWHCAQASPSARMSAP